MQFKVITFYKYERIGNTEKLMKELSEFCKTLNLLGRILMAKEGINAGVCGEKRDIEKFKKKIVGIFPGLTFREQKCKSNVYHKLVVRRRNEIVTFGKKADLRKKGRYVPPENLNRMIQNNEVILLDARNNYETKLGKFKNALTLEIENFRDFSREIEKLKHLKDKKIVTYCTGGVRCEKASAYMGEHGFKNVFQLDGGIIEYINKFPEDFEGSCFVFDDRLAFRVTESITSCEHCSEKCNIYINCHNLDCDELFVCCEKCQEKMNKTCSLKCKDSPRQRKELVN